jgi:hypothetical protein
MVFYLSNRESARQVTWCIKAQAWALGSGFWNLKPGPSPYQGLAQLGFEWARLGGLRAWGPAQHITTHKLPIHNLTASECNIMCQISGYELYLDWILSSGPVYIVYNVQSARNPLWHLKWHNYLHIQCIFGLKGLQHWVPLQQCKVIWKSARSNLCNFVAGNLKSAPCTLSTPSDYGQYDLWVGQFTCSYLSNMSCDLLATRSSAAPKDHNIIPYFS